MKKQRLDLVLVNRELFSSREKAKAAIMAGVVIVNNEKEDKPGVNIPTDAEIRIKENVCPYVSRGGLKLEKAINLFNLSFDGKVAMDVGASTGGFTDCMLKNGAIKVYAIDVGYGQLAWSLRSDDRVVCMERTNIRYVEPSSIIDEVSFSSIDVSFISLKKVLPIVAKILNKNGEIVALIKPQFEAGREQVGKKGVVRDSKVHKQVIVEILNFCLDNAIYLKGLTYSPIKGPEGNIEFLAYMSKDNKYNNEIDIEQDVEKVVKIAHSEINL